MNIPYRFKNFFWDVATESLNKRAHKSFLISRILEKGNFDVIRWLFKCYSISEILETINTSRNLSRSTISLWKMVLLPHESASQGSSEAR